MTKQILMDYIDACELIKETEEDIRNLRKQEIVHDKVKGSNPEFPYQGMSFNLEGAVETYLDEKHLEEEKKLLEERKKNANKIRIQAEEIMNKAPVRMQRIIRFRVLQQKSWDEVAAKMGGDCTGDSLRKEFARYVEKN